MLGYIEDRNGNKYEFKPNRHNMVVMEKLGTNAKDLNDSTSKIEYLENICFELLKSNYKELTKEKYEEMLDYNYEKLGMALYDLLGDCLESVFTQEEVDMKFNLFLQEKMNEKKKTN